MDLSMDFRVLHNNLLRVDSKMTDLLGFTNHLDLKSVDHQTETDQYSMVDHSNPLQVQVLTLVHRNSNPLSFDDQNVYPKRQLEADVNPSAPCRGN